MRIGHRPGSSGRVGTLGLQTRPKTLGKARTAQSLFRAVSIYAQPQALPEKQCVSEGGAPQYLETPGTVNDSPHKRA